MKFWKKYLSRLPIATLACTVAFSPLVPVSLSYATGSSFTDVRGHWAEPAISELAAKGIAEGKTSTLFYPDDSLTRAEFATFLVRSLELPLIKNTPSVFQDVKSDSWAFPYIQTAFTNQLVSGKSATLFAPNDRIMRQEIAKMIANALKVKSVSDSMKKTVQNYSDNAKIAGYAQEPIAAAAFLGILNGYPDVTFRPDTHATRSEAAKTLSNMLHVPKDKLDLVTKVPEPPKPEPQPEPEPPKPEPNVLVFAQMNLGQHLPDDSIAVRVELKDKDGQLLVIDNNRNATLVVKGPDGTSQYQAKSREGILQFSVSKRKAGQYSATVTADNTLDNTQTAKFDVVHADLVDVKLHVDETTFLKPTQRVYLKTNGLDAYGNEFALDKVTYSINDPQGGTITTTNEPAIGMWASGSVKGSYTITAQYGLYKDDQQVTVYTSNADLVAGKGEWMMWRDWKNYPVPDTIKRLKDAGVTHVYLEVSTTLDGFYGEDALNDFLPQAHEAGIAVICWIYADLKNPWKDSTQTVQALRYKTPSGDRVDGLAADLEENLSAYNVEEFAKGIRNNFGTYYPMIAVVYPASWSWIKQPWSTYNKYYDVMAPMVYWHYKAKAYTYNDAYNAIKAEMVAMRANTSADKPITMVGQSYNMFDTWQYPQAYEIRGAMQAAKDFSAVGYSTYRGRTATAEEWAEFAKFAW